MRLAPAVERRREPRYLCEALRLHRVFVISAGEDGEFGTADDIGSR